MKKTAGFPESFILLFLQMLTIGSAQFSVIGPAEPTLALEGQDAEMPCHLNTKESAEDMEGRLFRSQPSNIVHLYQHGKDQFGRQMEAYRGRTELVRDAMDYGSVAVRLHNVRVSDEGNYHCSFFDGSQNEAPLELQVVEKFLLELRQTLVELRTSQASESCKGLGTTMFDEKHYGTYFILTQVTFSCLITMLVHFLLPGAPSPFI
ncbi:myelin-oligodendrocyte glycoprotein-like [Ornithorhynchus anatinus]|uniref:myelin-oligodendrocyte glycoprotein-like n=1 Tax=Ornithorhynchus anatinus TaxID=9258 RepID=UPI0010A93C94|nr:myelin-oligodendrocyte glycoprotein-like [Ornithorhynchus anatinus]